MVSTKLFLPVPDTQEQVAAGLERTAEGPFWFLGGTCWLCLPWWEEQTVLLLWGFSYK
jgi:hypothetical protein